MILSDEILNRIESLVDTDLPTLRKIACGFDCEEIPTQSEANRFCQGQTKGELVSLILARENMSNS
jgi:hypothetical protein